MQNAALMKELLAVLKDMDYFEVYQSSRLQSQLSEATTDGDRIRLILRDSDVQEYIFPDWRELRASFKNPIDHYIQLRKNGTIPPR